MSGARGGRAAAVPGDFGALRGAEYGARPGSAPGRWAAARRQVTAPACAARRRPRVDGHC